MLIVTRTVSQAPSIQNVLPIIEFESFLKINLNHNIPDSLSPLTRPPYLTMASVQFEHVSKTFPNGHLALADLNLEINDGELMAIVGPSGCGKSTLLRSLAGLEQITSGHIRIDNVNVNALTPQERNVAMVFQDYALYPTMTVLGNLEFPLRMKKLPRVEIRSRVDRIADMLNLDNVLARLPKQLSGGQRQRVAMGRALVREPAVFLLDEPLSNLDAKLRTQVRTEIADLQKRVGTTMIYVTHDQIEAMTLGHRITIMNRGVVQQIADPQTLYQLPSTAFVAGFVGNPPMNLYTSPLVADCDDHVLVLWGQQSLKVASTQIRNAKLKADTTNVTWGVRPESVRFGGGLKAIIKAVEYLGHETLLYACPPDDAGIKPLIVRQTDRLHYQIGSIIGLRIEPTDVMVFECDSPD